MVQIKEHNPILLILNLILALAYAGWGNSGFTYAAGEPSWMGTKQLGTSGNDYGNGVTVDNSGNVYVTGYTYGGLDGNKNIGSTDMFLVKYNSAGAKQWTRQLGTPGYDYGNGVAIDGNGNIYVTGYTSDGLDGNKNAGSTDMFLAKYNSAGAKQWVRQLGTSGYDYANGVTVDGAGNVYVTGVTSNGLDGNKSAGSYDIFLVKYNSSGAKQWTRQLGTPGYDYGNGVTVDSDGNVYVTGYTYDELDGNTSAGGSDIFLVKYDSTGVKQWTRQLGTSGNDHGMGITADGSGNVYVTGDARSGIDGISCAGLDGNISAGHNDILLVKYDSSGAKLWSRLLGTLSYDCGLGVTVDHSDNIYVTGYTTGELDGNNRDENYNMFIAKYDASGTKQWARQLVTSFDNYGNGVTVDGGGDVYVTGYTYGGLDGNKSAGGIDMFLIKYNSSGIKQ